MFILRRVVWTLLLATAVLGPGLSARGDEKPLSLRDIGTLKQQRVPLDKIVEMAAEQGVSFTVTPVIEKQLGREGFTAEQIDALKLAFTSPKKADASQAGKAKKPDSAVKSPKADKPDSAEKPDSADKPDSAEKPAKAGTAAAIVPGQGLASSSEQRDYVLQQVTKITKLSGVSLEPLASKHVTLWAAKDDRAAFLLDIKKIETYFEGKCQEPLRSGLDKRSAHVVLLKTRYDYEKWINALFEVMPGAFEQPDAPEGNTDSKASMLKWPGVYTRTVHRDLHGRPGRPVGASPGGGRRGIHELHAAGRAPAARSAGDRVCQRRRGPGGRRPQVMLFSNSYHNEDRDLGQDPRAWLHLVQERMRTKKESGVRGLLNDGHHEHALAAICRGLDPGRGAGQAAGEVRQSAHGAPQGERHAQGDQARIWLGREEARGRVAQGGAGAEVIETFDRKMESRKIRKEDGERNMVSFSFPTSSFLP